MDESPTAIPIRTHGASAADGRAAALAERREAARNAVGEAQTRLARVQDDLARAAAEWRGQQAAWEDRQRRAAEDLTERSARLTEEELLRQREAADAAARHQEQAATLAERAALLDQREAELAARVLELDSREAAHTDQVSALETLAAEGQARQAELDRREAAMARQLEELAVQRQAVANMQDAAAATASAEATREIESLRSQLERLTAEHAAERDQWNAREQESKGSVAASQTEIKQLTEKAARQEAELVRFREQAAAAEARIAELSEQAAQAPQVDETRISDLEKRLQMAIDELRNERQRGADLQKQLADARVNASHAAGPGGGGMDWEAQKRKLLEALEEDFDGAAGSDKEERLSIEETIRVTSHVVDAKEREIEELRQLLEQQSSNFGSMAVGAAALSDLVDKDELLQQEREKLAALQAEWQGKLCQAEVELSLERAKLARERVDLEERLRVIEQHEASRPRGADTPPAAGKKPAGGRWLTRLGLRDGDG